MAVRGRLPRLVALLVSACAVAASGWAQEPVAPEGEAQEAGAGQALRVFLDCQSRSCDRDFFRREITFVNYTRDRQDAQVHLLMTSQTTGGGGSLFTFDFIGREDFEGIDERLETSTAPNAPREQVLTQLARTIQMGLMRYVARTPFADQIRISFQQAAEQAGVATEEDDPWNFWVFRVRANGSYFAEERQNFFNISGGLSANRITEKLKIQLSGSGRYSESNFDIDSVTSIKSINRNYDASGLVAWSLGERWAVGGAASVTHSTFSNEKLVVRVAPAVEYNIFPYAESARRLLRLNFSVGLTRFQWIEETVFLETEETRIDSRLSVGLDVKQPWGSAGGALEGVVFLDKPSQNRLVAFGFLEFRLIKGLSFNINGSAQRVRDQFNIEAGEATPDEILLRQRELLTGFRYSFSVGLSYTFGSIFSNVVNPRFGGSGRGFIRIF